MKKRIIIFVLTLFIAIAFLPISSMADSSITIEINKEQPLRFSFNPEEINRREWITDNPEVVSIYDYDKYDDYCLIKGEREGKADVTCIVYYKESDHSWNSDINKPISGWRDMVKTYTFHVTVKPEFIHVTEIKLARTEVKLQTEESITLHSTVLPKNADNKRVAYTSVDSSVAVVDDNGRITGKAPGKTYISVLAEDGSISAQCLVTVVQPLKLFKLNYSSAKVKISDTLTLKPKFIPSNVTDKKVTFHSSHSDIASISPKGVVTGKKKGTVWITATASGGSWKAKCRITVTKTSVPVGAIKLNQTKIAIGEGGTASLKASLLPLYATDKTVTWSSSKPSVASVTGNGIVKAVRRGKTIIYAASANGKKAKCVVTVTLPVKVTSITLKEEVTLLTGKTLKLIPVIAPSQATIKTITWKSGNPAVASVSRGGRVAAKKTGDTWIYAVTKDGSKQAKCHVYVEEAINVVGNIPIYGKSHFEVAKQGEWFYYGDPSENDALYKIKSDGSCKQLLYNSNVSNINVVGDWIYFINGSDWPRVPEKDHSIYRIRTDGTGKQKLCDDFCCWMLVIGDWIYFKDYGYNSDKQQFFPYPEMWRMKIDGTKKAKILDESSPIVNYQNGWLYYTIDDRLYRMRANGTKNQELGQICKPYFSFLRFYYDGWYYYGGTYNKRDCIYRISKDGSKVQRIFSDYWSDFFISDGVLYLSQHHIDFSSGKGVPYFKLYKMKPDGSERTLLTDQIETASIFVYKDWVYYLDAENNSSPRKIKTDGTQDQPLQ